MKVISQFLGYSFLILSVVVGIYLALIALDLAHHLYGIWGYVVGIMVLPITVPVAMVYQGFVGGGWMNLVELLILMPLLWTVGLALVRWGRRA